ncbi:hypothetical protein BDR07DRAFT_1495367 [Suillus spraguei]|nr:hypothetical protein BDR07DRAFT_1495367 [Suillus spraguei]
MMLSSSGGITGTSGDLTAHETMVIQARMLPSSWHELNDHGCSCRGQVRAQPGVGLSRSSGRGCKRSHFNKYIVAPSSSLLIAHERVKFTSQSHSGLAASRQDVFTSLDVAFSTDAHLTDTILNGDIGHDENGDWYEVMDEDPSLEVEAGHQTKHKCTAGDHPLLNWIDHQELFLLEMLHHDGRGDDVLLTFCSTCGITMCVVRAHAHSPMHCVEKWNGECFQNVTLKDLGLHVQLGHKISESCLLPNQAFNNDFVLIDT